MMVNDTFTRPCRRSSPPSSTLAPSPFTGSTPAIAFTKTLSTLYLAGFSFIKIHNILSAVFPSSPLLSESSYGLSSLSTTCKHLQHRDRSNPRSNPHLAVVASCPSPLYVRRLANDIFEKHFPTEAAQATEGDELVEIKAWYVRWRIEVRLCRISEFTDFNDRATRFEKVLIAIEHWLVMENVPISGWSRRIKNGLQTVSLLPATHLRMVSTQRCSRSLRSPSTDKNETISSNLQTGSSSPNRNRPTTPVPNTAATGVGSGPLMLKLDEQAKAAATGADAGGRHEGTAKPGRAQILDPEGFFSPRPKTASSTPFQNCSGGQ